MLPPFNENGDLPPGVHVAGWAEIAERFAQGRRRIRAMATLRRLHELASRTGSLSKLYVFGSFASAEPEPRDVDVVLIMVADFRVEDCTEEAQALFLHATAQARYGASVFWIREGTYADMRDFLLGWQIKRGGALRGILEVA
jgi:hypothetical protein